MYTNPFDVDDIAHKLEILAGDDTLRMAMIGRGLARKDQFSWDLTATKLWECIQKTTGLA
jgi:glycosyltransferase involved in cell wall biosynthesis